MQQNKVICKYFKTLIFYLQVSLKSCIHQEKYYWVFYFNNERRVGIVSSYVKHSCSLECMIEMVNER